MADEQPGHIARGVRDVSKVPLAKELVKNNVGSTVKNQEQTAQFAIVSQAESAAASAHYLDPSLQARLVPPPASPATTKASSGAGTPVNAGATIPSGCDGVNATNVETAEVRPAGQSMGGDKKAHNGGPVVIMSDADNYRPDPSRSKKRKTCCIQ